MEHGAAELQRRGAGGGLPGPGGGLPPLLHPVLRCIALHTALEFWSRFQGQRASSAYLVQEKEEREKQIRPNPCTVCLGTLQVHNVT